MLSEELQALAEEVGADVFDESGTDLVQIIRPTTGTNDYGGEAETTTEESIEYPCILEMPSVQGVSGNPTRWIVGNEYMRARIQMPAMYQGEAVEVLTTDKLRILEREGNNPERLYQVRDPQNVFGVYLDIGVVTETA